MTDLSFRPVKHLAALIRRSKVGCLALLEASISHPLFLPAAIVLAVALVLPSAWGGLYFDDYVFLGILSGSSPLSDVYPSRLDIFNFFGGSPERTRRMLDLGLLPWWTFPDSRLAFWRPVSALTHWLDYTAWRDLPTPMHVQSLLWFSGLVVTVALLYRRLMGRGSAAGVAALLYALDGAHASAILWVAARNALLGALFGTLTLLLHDRWRRGGWRAGSLAAPACLALALLSSEGAVATGAYLVAHALFMDQGGWRRRLAALLPYGVVVAAWQFLYTGLGYGVLGAGPGYLNPVREPLQFVAALAKNGPTLLLTQWAGPFADGLSRLSFRMAGTEWAGSLLALGLLTALLAPLVKQDPVARFWSLGQVLAVIPACAAHPRDRYLIFVGLGAMGLVGLFLSGFLERDPWRPAHLWWRCPATLLACALVVVHLVASPLHLVRSAITLGQDAVVQERAAASIPTDPAIRHQLLVVVNVPSVVLVSYSFFIRAVKGQPVPAQTRVLASGRASINVYRADARTLRVRWDGPQEHMFRASDHPMAARERVRLSGTDVR
jgi:hypothetical protein